MKNTILSLLALAIAMTALTAPDSLRCRLVDWMDAPSHHDFLHESYDYDHGYWYSGTSYWDLAMEDSFMVWLPGSEALYLVNVYEGDAIDTLFMYNSTTPFEYNGCVINDTFIYVTVQRDIGCYAITPDSLRYTSHAHIPFADFRNVAIEDSFLYVQNFGEGGKLLCVNIADPESIFVYRISSIGLEGIEVIDGNVHDYASGMATSDGPYDPRRPWWRLEKIDMFSGDTAFLDTAFSYYDRSLGDIASNDSLVFYVNSMMSNEYDDPPWEIGQSNLYVFERDYTHAFDQRWFGQGAFGVDVLNDHLVAVGFEHGFSVLNIDTLENIREVAYYMNPDSTMDFTHFAMKDSRIYAMGHPRAGYARLYMFDVGDTVATGQAEAELPEKPQAISLSAHPNPFNSACRFALEGVPRTGLEIEIFEINGRLVDALPAQWNTTLVWRPDGLPSGVYLARIIAGKYSQTKKLVYLQ